MENIAKLHQLGQSLWYDNIQRRLLENGYLADLITKGEVRGVTSNPTIFHKAIASSNDYDAALKPMAWAGLTAEQIFDQLAMEDIRAAADLFRPLYEQTKRGDGYVSLEVSPYLAHDAEKTLAEAKRLWAKVNRPNLMIKIPATVEGLTAIREAIAAGINVNVTLIFSLERYERVMDAYMSGLEKRLANGLAINTIASVASFFVSRMDNKVDPLLQTIIDKKSPQAKQTVGLLGKAAIANTRLAYAMFQKAFSGKRFEQLHKQGAAYQRPLWASTSTKNPAYRDVIYVEELIAPHTVNTVPPQTLDAFRDHGKASLSIEGRVEESQQVMDALHNLGISIDAITQELEAEGVKSFADAFTALIKTLDERRAVAQSELGPLAEAVPQRITKLEAVSAVKRLHEADASLWTDDEAGRSEIRKRLGWVKSPWNSVDMLPDLNRFVGECQDSGYTHALLLGMGGSSLAPEVFQLTFGNPEVNGKPGLKLTILDSTDPAQVRTAAQRSPIEKTLYIVSSKSGTTSEVNAFMDYFWERTQSRLGDKAGEHFIAITDPGSSLEKIARERGFRHVFQADPNVGGRYSALIAFGLVPAALIGVDVAHLLSRAQGMAKQCASDIPYACNPGLVLGAVMGEAALEGRDKLCLLIDPELHSLGWWLEQLIAESTGKQGKGIVPVESESLVLPASSEKDRLFVYVRHNGELDQFASRLKKAGHPVLELLVPDIYELGAEFYRWEMATAYACAVLGVNSFDQPDVQDAKTRTANKIASYRSSGKQDEGKPIWKGEDGCIYGIKFPGLKSSASLNDVIANFLKLVKPGDYVAINAYLPRDAKTLADLQKLRKKIQSQSGRATTLGFGPRFLHSTGQLHKGGGDNGVFIQITADAKADIEITGQGITFGVLERAQALGDLEALLARGRRAIRVHLTGSEIKDLI